MMNAGETCDVERAARGRATVMAGAAVVLMGDAILLTGSAADSAFSLRGAMWIVLVLMWLFILATGGGFNLSRERRQVMNDELSLKNRSRAITFGFAVTMIAALALYAGSWFDDLGTRDSLRLVTATGLSSALGRYAWLELW